MSQTFRVLLVEDDDSLRVCLGEFLASHGWEVAATAFGNEAMALAQRQRFDFSILDFHLPGMTGLELLQQLARIRPLPAILMSGLATLEEAAQAQRHGVFTFLRKPLELADLRRTVQQLIATHFGGPVIHFGLGPRLPGLSAQAARPTSPSAPNPSAPTQPPLPPTPRSPRNQSRPR